jgi:hypothetical protein
MLALLQGRLNKTAMLIDHLVHDRAHALPTEPASPHVRPASNASNPRHRRTRSDRID